jgi:DNA-damage-inducible protein D
MTADLERLELRKQASEEFKALSGAARFSGVQDRMFGIFHDAGYKGLYGGLGSDEIKNRKSIPAREQLMDRMDSTELAANQFRMTQTREKLAKDRIRDQEAAILTHREVGLEVRNAIKKIGGRLPELIPAAEPIANVKKRVRNSAPKLELAEKDAKGLIGSTEDDLA